MSTTATQRTRAILEAGYKIVPGKEAGFFEYYKEFVPIAMKQDGFESVFGGPILDSTWLSFRVNFESAEQMDAWHRNPTHQAVQRSAYERWWTAAYLRKWREAAPGEVLQGRVMCEARLLREAKLNAADIQSLREALAGIAEAGAEPFETLTGDFEPQPYQFAGPVGIAPKVDGVLYTLVTHWSSPEKCHAWQESDSYLALERLGKVTSEVFMPLPEAYPRDRLREDKLQRQWTLAGTTESAQFAKASAQTAVGRNER